MALISNSRRANAFTDTLIVIFILFVFIITGIFGLRLFTDINTEIQDDVTMTNESKAVSGNLYTVYPSLIDGMFMSIFVFMWLVVIVASFMVDAHPIFFWISVIVLAFVIIVGMVFANTYQELRTEGDIITFADSFPMANNIMDYLGLYTLLIGVSIILALYGKNVIT